MERNVVGLPQINIDTPLWSQATFIGRLKHFFWVTDPRTALCSNQQLDDAKHLVEQYRLGNNLPGTTEEKLLYAKKLYESSFHPDSGERQNVFGRMSFQVPGGMAITGAMLAFYKTNSAVIFWQWINQSFNALVNYTNRNAKSDITTKRITVAYISATTCAVITAIGLKQYLAKRASPLMQRFVPFAAVAAANCVNIPLMRQSEIASGIAISDDNNNHLGESTVAAVTGISQVTLSRITIAAPGMLLVPVISSRLERFPWLSQRISYLNLPLQTALVGMFLIFMVPVGCALFPQRACLHTSTLEKYEPTAAKKLQEVYSDQQRNAPDVVYFNKGL